jgi:hypothetical protein
MMLQAYERLICLLLGELAVDGCISEAPSPCEGEKAGKSLVNRGKWGIKRSTVMDARGIPLELVTALADRQDSPLLDEALAANLRLAR